MSSDGLVGVSVPQAPGHVRGAKQRLVLLVDVDAELCAMLATSSQKGTVLHFPDIAPK